MLAALLAAARAEPVSSLDDFLRALATIDRPPFAAAVAGGALADRVGYAFVAGIRAALSRLLPGLPRTTTPALCITEARGAHPRDIDTRFDESAGTVEGRKVWATLAPRADRLFVLAKAGEAGGRSVLRLVEVDARAEGVHIEPMPETPFAPEVPHAVVTLGRARIAAAREGDGFEHYAKPFRTVEDIHVMAALLAHVVVEARARDWPRPVVEDALATIEALGSLSDRAPLAAATHIGLAGALRGARAVLDAVDALFGGAGDGDEAARRWVRDRPLRDVAARVRELRTDAAWRRLEARGAPPDET